MQWYLEQKPYTIHEGNISVSMIEYPQELGWISFYKNQLNQNLIDSLYKNSPDILQFKLTITDSSISENNIQEMPISQGNSITAFINNNRVLDCTRIGNTMKSTMTENYFIVVKKSDILGESNFTILDNRYQKQYQIKASSVLLKNKKKLTL